MPKSEAGQDRQMITKGSEKYILSLMPAVDEIKSAWYVPRGSSGNQRSTIAKLGLRPGVIQRIPYETVLQTVVEQ